MRGRRRSKQNFLVIPTCYPSRFPPPPPDRFKITFLKNNGMSALIVSATQSETGSPSTCQRRNGIPKDKQFKNRASMPQFTVPPSPLLTDTKSQVPCPKARHSDRVLHSDQRSTHIRRKGLNDEDSQEIIMLSDPLSSQWLCNGAQRVFGSDTG